MSAVFGLFLLAAAVLLIVLAQKIAWLDKIGVVILAFASGLLFSYLYQPTDALLAAQLMSVKTQISEVAIALAIPLLLFSINIPASLKLAGSALKGMMLACLGMCVATAITSFWFRDEVSLIWQAAGMMVGAYTGGGQNIGAVKAAINANDSLFIDMVTYDIVLSALYLLFAMTLLKPIARLFLTDFQDTSLRQIDKSLANKDAQQFMHLTHEGAALFTGLTHKQSLPKLGLALGLSAACIAVSVVISGLIDSPMQSAITIILLTTLGALLSYIPKVRQLKVSYPLGMVFILIFCFASGSMANLSLTAEFKWGLFGYISATLALAIVLHGLLCKLFKVDADTFVITGAAAIMSVPFIPMIASSIKNKALLFPGIAVAVMGYVLGNYLGIAMAYLLRSVI